ncbi:efflux transporter outer membrane subunit [Ideonella sp.]|uniref:efflux transporter outer membrane subunit n=1 Tax=Ideonella sp. TaxID=1929293 RepID=UPI0035B1F4F6
MKKNLQFPFALPALALALWLAGCASTPAIDPVAVSPVPAAFKEAGAQWAPTAPAEAQARGAWWQAFADPVLDQLVERAGERNTSVQAAAARLAQARALLGRANAERWPQVGVSAGVQRLASPDTGWQPANLGSAGASVSYEADLFGRLSRSAQAATLDAQARDALLQSTRLMAQADVAQSYFQLRALDVERGIVGDTLTAHRNTLRLVESRQRAGDVAELDVARVRTELAETESEALALDARRALLEHAIAVLVGDNVAGFAIDAAPWRGVVPQVPAGVPSAVLARRPDVAAALSQMQAAQLRVGVAQAAWFPNLSLTASGGYASPELSDVFKWSARSWAVGALLSLPVFDGGRRQAGVDAAQAALELSLADYRQQVLGAFREVEDELALLRSLDERSKAQARAVESAARATTLSESRYRNGLVSQLELLDAQRSELRSRRQEVQVKVAQFQSTVGLIRALGGGWGGDSQVALR